MDLQINRIAISTVALCLVGACAEGLHTPGEGQGGEGNDGWTGQGPASSSSGSGIGGMGGMSNIGGQGGMGASGGASSSSSSASSSASSTSSSASSASSSASSSSTAASSSSSSSSTSSSSSSSTSTSSSGGGVCPGTIIDWNWNLGTAPTNLSYSGSTWAIGTATKGPADGLTYLATSPVAGSYPPVANDWAMLPAVDLSAYAMCQLRVTVELWRDAEKYGLVNYDGGNLQYTADAAGAGGWALVGGATMAYDGKLTDCVGSCLVLNQQTWTTSANPKWKTAIYEATMPPAPIVRLRFTFHSDISNELGPLAGIYVRRLQVEVY